MENFHGNSFESPVQRMKEYVEIIRMAMRGEKINYSGKIFSLKDFSLLTKPKRKEIPIYLAAINQKMVEMTWDIADGVIFYLRPKNEMKETISRMQKKKKIDNYKIQKRIRKIILNFFLKMIIMRIKSNFFNYYKK